MTDGIGVKVTKLRIKGETLCFGAAKSLKMYSFCDNCGNIGITQWIARIAV
jgi:hypothetical protein